MEQNSLSSVQLLTSQRYSSLFHFYLARDIDDLCVARAHSPFVILLEDFNRLDCEDEMLKRFYGIDETSRINQLACNFCQI